MARSSSSVVTPIDNAMVKAASVFSGAKPRAPRWPWRSNATATEPRKKLTTNHSSCGDSRHGHAPSSRRSVERPTLTTTARRYYDAVTPHEWRWLLARIEANEIFSRNRKFNQATAKPPNYSSTLSCAWSRQLHEWIHRANLWRR